MVNKSQEEQNSKINTKSAVTNEDDTNEVRIKHCNTCLLKLKNGTNRDIFVE